MKSFIRKRLSLVVFAALLMSFVPIYAIQARAATSTWEEMEDVKEKTFTEEPSEGITSYILYKSDGTSKTVDIDKTKDRGTEQNPIGISSEAELILFGQQTSDTTGKYYILDKPGGEYDMQDDTRTMLPLFKISTSSGSGMPDSGTPFKGTLIGGGATIKNANIGDYSDTAYTPGLFGKLDGGVVTGITLESCTLYIGDSVSTTNLPAGALVAHLNAGAVINCGETGSTFTGIGAKAKFFGGLVGYAGNSSAILNCYATSNVSSTVDSAHVGSLVGYSGGTVQNCYATGSATGGNTAHVGGLVGYSGGTVQNCYATGSATGGESASVGGLVGYSGGTVQYCYAAGNAKGGDGAYVGGLAGYVESNGTVQYCYAAGTAKVGSGSDTYTVVGSQSGGTVSDNYTCTFTTATQTFSYTEGDGTTYAKDGDTLLDTLNAWALDNAGYSGWAQDGTTNGGYPYHTYAPPVPPAPTPPTPPIYIPPATPDHGFAGDGTYTKGSGKDLVHITEKDFALFSGVKIDNNTLTRDTDYKAESGSTVVTVFAEYLDTLTVGKHTLTVLFTDGVTVTAVFEILEPWVNPFADVDEDDWFYGDVEYVYENGLMTGTAANMFSPNAFLTRGMIVTILWRQEGSPVGDGVPPFTDVTEGAYYYDAVAWAAANGIVEGYGGGLFGPDNDVTRQDLAVILLRYMDYSGIEYVVTEEYRFFADEDEIAPYAKNAIQILNKLDIIRGRGGNIIDPLGNASRANAAAMLHRLLEM